MKKLMTLILAAGLFFAGTVPSANAIEFKAQGEWLMGFGAGDTSLINKARENGARSKSKYNNDDKFSAMQRVRLQLDAVASENLSGTVLFELLESTWGQAESGGALGGDGQIVGCSMPTLTGQCRTRTSRCAWAFSPSRCPMWPAVPAS